MNHLASLSSQNEVFSTPITPLTPSGFRVSSVTAVKDYSSLSSLQKAISANVDSGVPKVPSQTTGSIDGHRYSPSNIVSQPTSEVDYSVPPGTSEVSWEGRGVSRLSDSFSESKSIVEHTAVSKGVEFATASIVTSHSSLRFKEAPATSSAASHTVVSVPDLSHGRDAIITVSTSQYASVAELHGTGTSGEDMSSTLSGSGNMMSLETHFTGAATRFRSNSFEFLVALVAGYLLM